MGKNGRYRPQHPALAGAMTGGIEICITFPLEFVKVQLQLQNVSGNSLQGHPSFKGPIHCAASTFRQNGVCGLYAGLSPWLIFAFPRSAIRFMTFENVATQLQGGQGELSPLIALGAGTVAGVTESALCLTPLQNIQIRMTQDSIAEKGSKRYRWDIGFLHALREIWRMEGIRAGFFGGIWPTVVKGAVNNCIRFVVYNETSKVVRKARGAETDEALGALTTFGLGAMAGAVSAVVTQPIDTVKSNLQGMSAGMYKGSLHCAREIVAVDGAAGLFRGLTPRVCRVCLEIGLHFSLYDYLCRLLDRAVP
ncbi:unnamed protein product [Discosporangium mesarthrocarpum]